MKEIIYKEDAIHAIERMKGMARSEEVISKESAIYALKGLPSAEPEVIRCKDCENWDTSWKPTSSSGKSHYCALKDGVWEPNDYCSSAERRGEQE